MKTLVVCLLLALSFQTQTQAQQTWPTTTCDQNGVWVDQLVSIDFFECGTLFEEVGGVCWQCQWCTATCYDEETHQTYEDKYVWGCVAVGCG